MMVVLDEIRHNEHFRPKFDVGFFQHDQILRVGAIALFSPCSTNSSTLSRLIPFLALL